MQAHRRHKGSLVLFDRVGGSIGRGPISAWPLLDKEDGRVTSNLAPASTRADRLFQEPIL
jgi:hypothetical protein